MKLYVGNLPYTCTEEDLRDLFSNYSTLGDVKLIMDRATGRSKGFGFVEITSDDEATEAISELNGKEIEGRALTVNEALPPKEKSNNRFSKARSFR